MRWLILILICTTPAVADHYKTERECQTARHGWSFRCSFDQEKQETLILTHKRPTEVWSQNDLSAYTRIIMAYKDDGAAGRTIDLFIVDDWGRTERCNQLMLQDVYRLRDIKPGIHFSRQAFPRCAWW